MRRLKKSHKNLMILESGFVYCKRHGLDYETFIDNVFMAKDFDCSEGSEFDNICKDLRFYRTFDSWLLKEVTHKEYEMCVDMFGEN